MASQPIRFLADESCDHAVVRALRGAGHDVLALSEVEQRSVDREVIARALREDRIRLTEDKDFGWLAHVSGAASPGVVLARFPGNARKRLVETVLELVRDHRAELATSFVVLQPGQIRIDRKPSARE